MPPKNQNQEIDDDSSSSAAGGESQNSSASTEEESDSKQEPGWMANGKQNASVNQHKEFESNDENNDEEVEDEDDEKGSSSFSDSPVEKNTNPASKRSFEFAKSDAKESTSNKKVKTSEDNGQKKRFISIYYDGRNAITRVWSWADGIALLEGAIDYINQTGSDPSANMSDFYEFVKGDIFAGVSKTQVSLKLGSFKTRFFRKQGTGVDGGDPVYSNPYEYKSFELSKNIWGGGSYVEDFLAKYPNLRGSFDMEAGSLRDHVHLIGHTRATKLERKWTELRMEEMELMTKKLNLMAGHIKLVLDAMKND